MSQEIIFLVVIVIGAATLGVAVDCHAQLDFPHALPSPVGSGARAAGMANAFVAVADDATAASWNPAGLVQLELPEVSVVGAYNRIREDFKNIELDPMFPSGFASTQRDDRGHLNFLSFVYPTHIGDHSLALSLSYQERLEFARRFSVQDNGRITDLDVTNRFRATLRQKGSFSVITPSVAYALNNKLSLGVSLNLWTSSLFSENDINTTLATTTTTTQGNAVIGEGTTFDHSKYNDFSGQNVVVGVLWSPTPRWNLAFRYDTAFRGSAGFHSDGYQTGSSVPDGFQLSTPVNERHKINFPATAAVGTAVRFTDRFTGSFDLSWTDWNDAYIRTGGNNPQKLSLVDGVELGTSASTRFKTVVNARLGGEYVFIPKYPGETLDMLWTLRGGVFIEEEPASGRPTLTDTPVPGDGMPDRFYGAAVGIGLLAKQRVNIDISYQIRYGSNVKSDYVFGIPGFREDSIQHQVMMSLVIYL